LHDIILQAGTITLEHKARLADIAVCRKSDKDLVTEADVAVENFIIESIKSRWPHHGILGEESGAHAGSEYCWVIDPIDGTTPFSTTCPSTASPLPCSITTDCLAAVFAPLLEELFIAEKGKALCSTANPSAPQTARFYPTA
jgi:myo-inositol-1(or 4)-monophosphatase